jgi:hypothetical protein
MSILDYIWHSIPAIRCLSDIFDQSFGENGYLNRSMDILDRELNGKAPFKLTAKRYRGESVSKAPRTPHVVAPRNCAEIGRHSSNSIDGKSKCAVS